MIAAEPMDYADFIALEAEARLVVTDSGGVQEETTVLGTPCLTYRTTTERPITVELGTNELVGVDPGALREAAERVAGRRSAGEATRDPALGRAGGAPRGGRHRGISRAQSAPTGASSGARIAQRQACRSAARMPAP